ncbi:MAG: hypothetical protein ACD_7C00020G0001, partial [uncultured bacterium]
LGAILHWKAKVIWGDILYWKRLRIDRYPRCCKIEVLNTLTTEKVGIQYNEFL